MLVVDTSAVVATLVGRPPVPRLVDRLGTDGDLHAPHLLDVELLHALRRLVRTGELSQERAADARADFAELAVVRYGHEALADRTWELRDSLTAYDATFVALAEALGVPLVTCDARLARAPGHRAAVELFGGG
ncbi:MAG TPA: type II toxin-antitoxin system VapC family toxin [Actinomycetes bacterium]|nr:type II toxin-antitoxin system VapC family toxin [Actinomycetes bacterium]